MDQQTKPRRWTASFRFVPDPPSRGSAAVAALVLGCWAHSARLPAQAPTESSYPVRGRVVDSAGKPLGSVAILVSPRPEYGEAIPPTESAISAPTAKTAADGGFELTLTLRQQLTFAAKGRATLQALLSESGDPRFALRELGPDGAIDLGMLVLPDAIDLPGRVAGANGTPLAGAKISSNDMVGDRGRNSGITPTRRYASAALSDAAGRFVLRGVFAEALSVTAESEGHATTRLQPVDRTTPLSLTLQATGALPSRDEAASLQPAEPPSRDFLVRAECEGKPVREFTATVQWHAGDNPFVAMMRSVLPYTAAVNGIARFAKPSADQPHRGTVSIRAAGYAAETITCSWDPAKPEWVVKLVPESVVSGKLIGADGKPLPYTRVRVAKPQAAPPGFPAGARLDIDPMWTGVGEGELLTERDGSFRVGGLPAGNYQVTTWPSEQPAAAKLELRLGVGEQKLDVTIQSPRGTTLRGRIDGPGPGVPAWLEIRPAPRGNERSVQALLGGNAPVRRVRLDVDNTFVVAGLSQGKHDLVLALLAHPRARAPVMHSLGQVTVGADDVEATLKASGLQASILGKVTIEGASAPRQRFLVLAKPVSPQGTDLVLTTSSNDWPSASRVALDAEGGFALRVAPGEHVLEVYDLLTHLRVATSEPITVTDQGVTSDVKVGLGRLRVVLRATDGDPIDVERITLRVPDRRMARFGRANHFDTGAGLLLARGQTTLEVEVPLGDLEVIAYAHQQAFGSQQALGRADVTIAADKVAEVKVDVAPLQPTGK